MEVFGGLKVIAGELLLVFGLVFLGLVALGTPIAPAMGVGSVVLMLFGDVPFPVIPTRMVEYILKWVWLAVPLYLFLGEVLVESGITEKLAKLSHSYIGFIRGGLSHVTVLTNILMAGMSGSFLADAAATCRIFLKPMEEAGYPKGYTAAITAVGGLIGPLIPPSVILIIIGTAGEISILRLWIGAALPGVVLGIMLIIIGYILSVRKKIPIPPKVDWGARLYNTWVCIPALAIPFLIIGGMRAGWFTATEGAAVAAAYVIILGFSIYRGSLTARKVLGCLNRSATASASILVIVAVAGVVHYLIGRLQFGTAVADVVATAAVNKTVLLFLISGIVLVLGCFIDATPINLILVPLLMPTIIKAGIDPVHFGVTFCLAVLTGQLTPPVALTMLLTCQIAGCSVAEWLKEGWPFMIGIVIVLILAILFPQLILWLPSVMVEIPGG